MADHPAVETENKETATQETTAQAAASQTPKAQSAEPQTPETKAPEAEGEKTAAQPQESEPKTPASKPQKPKRKHKKKHYVLRIAILLAVLVVAFVCAHLSYFNLNGIAVIGNEEVTDEEIIKLSGIKTGESVFDVHPLLVQHDIKKKNLYIEKVNVNRKLPDKVEIIVQERDMLAQFHKDQKFVVTDSEGMVLDISKEARKATLIEGLTVTGAEKKDTIGIKEEGKLKKALELMKTTDENDLYFKRIVFNGSKVDAYVYDTLKCSGKYDNLMASITSGTLKKVIYDLYQKNIEKGTVNVYNNDYCFFTPN